MKDRKRRSLWAREDGTTSITARVLSAGGRDAKGHERHQDVRIEEESLVVNNPVASEHRQGVDSTIHELSTALSIQRARNMESWGTGQE